MTKLLLNADGKVLTSNYKVLKAPEVEDTLQTLINDSKRMIETFRNTSNELVQKLFKTLDTSRVTDMEGAFISSDIESIPKTLDCSSCKRTYDMFRLCGDLIIAEVPDISKSAACNSMFWTCTKLEEVIFEKLPVSTTAGSMFSDCRKLKKITVKENETVQWSGLSYTFSGCGVLEEIPIIFDVRNITIKGNIDGIVSGCTALKKLTLLNIKCDLTIGQGNGTISSDYGHLLTLESLINTIKELVNVGSTKTLKMGTANLEKIQDVYVRRTTEGDIPTCLSDNSNIDLAKAPCEICESTDEGAMLITAYANSKNWTLA